MFCIKCGTKYDADGVYCRQCGNPLHEPVAGNHAPQNAPPGGAPPPYYQQPPVQYPGQHGVHQQNVKPPGETMIRVFGTLLAVAAALSIISFFRQIGFGLDLFAWVLTLACGIAASVVPPKKELVIVIIVFGIILTLYHLAVFLNYSIFFSDFANSMRLAVVFLSLLLSIGADKRRRVRV